jgi:hypothetical protein
MGIFVSTFCFKHLATITRGYTTKQLYSIKVFEKEIISKELNIKNPNMNYNKAGNENYNKDFNIYNKLNNEYESNEELKFLVRIKNLCKFYLKKTPKSLVANEN